MKKYQVVLYDNVVQNEEGLWSADRKSSDVFISIADDAKSKQVCEMLKSAAILSSSNMRTLYVTDLTSDIIEIKEKKGMKPICRLERRFYV